MEHDGLPQDDKSKSYFSHVLWFNEDGERLNILREIREAMTPGERSRLNTPVAARQRVEAVLKARRGDTEEKVKASPVVLLKDQLAAASREIAQLKAKLERLEQRDDHANVYFDLRKDDAKHIGETMTQHMEELKFDRVVKAAKERFRTKRYKAG